MEKSLVQLYRPGPLRPRLSFEKVWAAFFSQPVEIISLHKEISANFGRSDVPQLVFGLGHGPQVLPIPRCGVNEVLL